MRPSAGREVIILDILLWAHVNVLSFGIRKVYVTCPIKEIVWAFEWFTMATRRTEGVFSSSMRGRQTDVPHAHERVEIERPCQRWCSDTQAQISKINTCTTVSQCNPHTSVQMLRSPQHSPIFWSTSSLTDGAHVPEWSGNQVAIARGFRLEQPVSYSRFI